CYTTCPLEGEALPMIDHMKMRLGSEEGFTLIELLVVIFFLGILLPLALPSFPTRRSSDLKSAAQANVRAVLPDIESYNADNTVGNTTNDPDRETDTTHSDSGYQGMTAALLKSNYDQAFPSAVWIIGSNDVGGATPPTGTGITANGALSTTNYCVVAQNGSWYAWKHGPGGTISVSTDANTICT